MNEPATSGFIFRMTGITSRSRGVLCGRYLAVISDVNLPASCSSTAHKKPSLKTDAVGEREAGEMLRFNLSHSGGIALLALATRRDVGVDVEFMRDQISTDDLANRFFSHRESATLRALAPELRRTAFFKCWTRKEAFIKAKGGGLSIPLDQFDVAFAPTEQPALLRTAWDTNEASLWSMHDLAAGEEYAAALVVQDSPRRISCWQFTSAL